jgi:hypothetical protein
VISQRIEDRKNGAEFAATVPQTAKMMKKL